VFAANSQINQRCIIKHDVRDGKLMQQFLAEVEHRAYRMAYMATGNRDDALDIVQDAMMKLVQKYSNKEQSAWKPLFYRILELQDAEFMQALETALQGLPVRQQQVFMLRLWEGLDIAETAAAMQCSQSSVKTHYARALEKLRGALKAYQ